MSSGLFFVKALFEYSSPHEDDLQFSVGQIISVTNQDDEEWYTGEYIDDAGSKQEGIFPRNFVERLEPAAPPRPVRRTKKEVESLQPEGTPVTSARSGSMSDENERPAPLPPSDFSRGEVSTLPEPPATIPPTQLPISEPETFLTPNQAQPGSPPTIAETPASGSIRDRIAAFNKPGGGPITPFKPKSLNYIKKPFVAPPPSRDSYVPPPRTDTLPRLYSRDEDASSKAGDTVVREPAEHMLTTATPQDVEKVHEDTPKHASLQERIALLQKQQAEAAQRHAEALTKKEKPKRPHKKRVESSEVIGTVATSEPSDANATGGSSSFDEPRSLPSNRRKSTRDSHSVNPSDGNEADMSGAGDTTEGAEDLTEKEESEGRSKIIAHPYKATMVKAEGGKQSTMYGQAGGQDDNDGEPKGGEEEEEEEEDEEEEGEREGEGAEEEEDEEEDEIDSEIRRKEELRARMAKMSGGMGMPGMFMPMHAPTLPKKKRTTPPKDNVRNETIEEPSPNARAAPPIPTLMALPGMSTRSSVEPPFEQEIAVQTTPLPLPANSMLTKPG